MNPPATPAVPVDPQRGSATVELVLVTPLLVAVLLLVVALGRSVEARLDVDAAARDAARAAAIARTPAQAHTDAVAAAGAALDRGGVTCRTLDVGVDLGRFQPGGSVAVAVTCTVDLSDLTLLRLGDATKEFTARAASVIDTYREFP